MHTRKSSRPTSIVAPTDLKSSTPFLASYCNYPGVDTIASQKWSATFEVGLVLLLRRPATFSSVHARAAQATTPHS